MTSTGRTWFIVTLAGRIWLILAEYDFPWQNMIYTGIVTLTGRICSQSKVFCRSALLCRFNIPDGRRVCCWAPCEQEISIVSRRRRVPAAGALSSNGAAARRSPGSGKCEQWLVDSRRTRLNRDWFTSESDFRLTIFMFIVHKRQAQVHTSLQIMMMMIRLQN